MAQRILLFDVDGTLTLPRLKITPEMKTFISELRSKVKIGIVGGSDLPKQKEQLGDYLLNEWDYVFSENGLIAFKDGKPLATQSFTKWLGEDKFKKLVNFILHYIADSDIPIKRGTFIECRASMLNVSPIGRNCSQKEREEFEKYDLDYGIRSKMIEALKTEFPDYGLTYSIGGQISFDLFPNGWDKTYCLQFLQKDGFEEIHFFGDKTSKGGNDYEIFNSDLTIGHSVTNPDETMDQVKSLMKS